MAPARWERLAYAKQILGPAGCPVVGNGDVDSPGQYQRMLDETGVDGVMIGRAAMANPFIFYGIRWVMLALRMAGFLVLICSTGMLDYYNQHGGP